MFKSSKKSWFVALAALMSVQAAIPAWAHATRANFANTLQGLSDEEVAVQLTLLTKDEKALLLNDIARMLDEDLNSLAELETELQSEQKINVVLNTGAKLSEVTMVLTFLASSYTGNTKEGARKMLRYSGIALGMSVVLGAVTRAQRGMIALDRVEAKQLAEKIQLQRQLVTALTKNLLTK